MTLRVPGGTPTAMTDLMDVRVRDRYISKGRLKLDEVLKSDAELPDLEEQSDFVDYESRFEEERKRDVETTAAADVAATATNDTF